MRLLKLLSISKLSFFNKLKLQHNNGLELLNDAKNNCKNINIRYNDKDLTIVEILNKLSDSDYLENILQVLSSDFIKYINMELSIQNNNPMDIGVCIQINILIKQILYKYNIGNYSVHVVIDLSNYSTYLIKLYVI